MRRQEIAGGNTNVSRELLVTPDDAAFECHHFSFNVLGTTENFLARRRELISMDRAVKQSHSQSLLEGDYAARHSGVADVK